MTKHDKNSKHVSLGKKLGTAAALVVAISVWQQPFITRAIAAPAAPVAIAMPAVDLPAGGAKSAKMILAGGCFWGVQGVFQHVRGVTNAVSGYVGSNPSTANYADVSSGKTGHAEAVEITYDPSVVSFGKLLQIFFAIAHDPTELNRQGPDTGTQYRSAIFPQNPQQRQVAQAYITQLDTSQVFKQKIETRIENDQRFFPAEAYHQNYLTLNPTSRYIAIHDLPKVANLKLAAPDLYRDDPVLVPLTR